VWAREQKERERDFITHGHFDNYRKSRINVYLVQRRHRNVQNYIQDDKSLSLNKTPPNISVEAAHCIWKDYRSFKVLLPDLFHHFICNSEFTYHMLQPFPGICTRTWSHWAKET